MALNIEIPMLLGVGKYFVVTIKKQKKSWATTLWWEPL